MASDGFELLRAYIALAVNQGDFQSVTQKLDQVKKDLNSIAKTTTVRVNVNAQQAQSAVQSTVDELLGARKAVKDLSNSFLGLSSTTSSAAAAVTGASSSIASSVDSMLGVRNVTRQMGSAFLGLETSVSNAANAIARASASVSSSVDEMLGATKPIADIGQAYLGLAGNASRVGRAVQGVGGVAGQTVDNMLGLKTAVKDTSGAFLGLGNAATGAVQKVRVAARETKASIDELLGNTANKKLENASGLLSIISKSPGQVKFKNDFVSGLDLAATGIDLTKRKLEDEKKARTAFEKEMQRLQKESAAEAERLVREAQRRMKRLRAETERTNQQIARLKGNILLETGFLFPSLQGVGNVFRAGEAVQGLASKLGLAATAASKLGVVFKVLVVLLKAVSFVSDAGFGLAKAFNERVFNAIVGGFQAVVAPVNLAYQAIRRFATYLPVIAIGLGVALAESLSTAIAQFERLERTFRFAFASDSARQLQFVRDTADALGLDLEQLSAGYSKLTVAARFAGVPLADVRQLFLGTAEAAAVLGLGSDDLAGVFRALEQVISKGKVSAEELRGQLGERLAGAFGLAARSLGIAQEQLDEFLQSGALRSRQFVAALGVELRRTFGPEAGEATDALPAKLARLQNSILDLKLLIRDTGFAQSFIDLKLAIVNLVNQGPLKNVFVQAFTQAGRFFAFVERSIPTILPLLDSFRRVVQPIVEAFLKLQLIVNSLIAGAFKEFIDTTNKLDGTARGLLFTLSRVADVFQRASGIDFSSFESVFKFVQAALENSEASLGAVKRILQNTFSGLSQAFGVLASRLPEAAFRLGSVFGAEFAKGFFKGFFDRNPQDFFASNPDFFAQIFNDAAKAALEPFTQDPQLLNYLEALGQEAKKIENKGVQGAKNVRKELEKITTGPLSEVNFKSDIKSESRFLGLEDFQKFLQEGDNAQTRIADNVGLNVDATNRVADEIQALRRDNATARDEFRRGALRPGVGAALGAF